MAHPIWPSALPQKVIADSYSEKFRDGRMFSQMSSGPPKVRRRFSSAVKPVSASIIVTYGQAAILERFWEDDTKGGSLPFYIRDQRNDGLPILEGNNLPILEGNGLPILISSRWLVLFGEGGVELRSWGLQFQATFQLLVMP